MATPQTGLLHPAAPHSRFVELSFAEGAGGRELRLALSALRAATDADRAQLTLGFGTDAWRGLVPDSAMPDELANFAGAAGAPATPRDLWLRVSADDRERLAEQVRKATLALGPAVTVVEDVPASVDAPPSGAGSDKAEHAVVPDGERGEGGTLLFSQRWIHDPEAWGALSEDERERAITDTLRAAGEAGGEVVLRVARVPGAGEGEGGAAREGAPGRPPTTEALEPGLYLLAAARERAALERVAESVAAGDEAGSPLARTARAVSGAIWFVPGVEDLELAGWS